MEYQIAKPGRIIIAHLSEGDELYECIESLAEKENIRASGQCLCGGVRYEVRGPLRPVLECHCRTCRRFTGGLWNATAARREHVTLRDERTLKWYQSSPQVRRGFCGECGSSLVWDRKDRTYLGITAGSLDEPTGLELAARIFTGEAGDYYKFGPEIPSHLDANHGLEFPEFK